MTDLVVCSIGVTLTPAGASVATVTDAVAGNAVRPRSFVMGLVAPCICGMIGMPGDWGAE